MRPRSAGWLRIEGAIGADGSARFEGARGSGRRLEQRVCNLAFERR
jgi:hypothetical protein